MAAAMPVSLSMPSFAGSYDGPLGQKIIELHVWAVGQGLRGAEAAPLFDKFCQRLVSAGVPLWRAFAGIRTLHPQWGGCGYTWRRRLNAIEPQQFERGHRYEQTVVNSPFGHLIRLGDVMAATAPAEDARSWLHLRRRLSGAEAQLDFPLLEELAAAGATDYFAEVVRFGAAGDASRGTGVGYSFATDRPGGFSDDALRLLKAVLPVVSLAVMAHAGHTIAASLLEGYLGAVDRLDFTVIGPAVNEVARIETLCEPLGRKVLVSAALAAAVAESPRLEPLGTHVLRGVRDPREIHGLDLG